MTSEHDIRSHEAAVLNTKLDGVQQDVSEIKTNLQDLSKTLLLLVKVEQRQLQQHEQLTHAVRTIEQHDVRLAKLEKDLPQLTELRKWIIAGVSALALAAFAAVIQGKMDVRFGERVDRLEREHPAVSQPQSVQPSAR